MTQRNDSVFPDSGTKVLKALLPWTVSSWHNKVFLFDQSSSEVGRWDLLISRYWNHLCASGSCCSPVRRWWRRLLLTWRVKSWRVKTIRWHSGGVLGDNSEDVFVFLQFLLRFCRFSPYFCWNFCVVVKTCNPPRIISPCAAGSVFICFSSFPPNDNPHLSFRLHLSEENAAKTSCTMHARGKQRWKPLFMLRGQTEGFQEVSSAILVFSGTGNPPACRGKICSGINWLIYVTFENLH